jgi:hypothetical protein
LSFLCIVYYARNIIETIVDYIYTINSKNYQNEELFYWGE